MPQNKGKEPPLISRENCETFIKTYSINSFRTYKSVNKDIYNNEINSLSRICAILITHYHETPQTVIASIETSLRENHSKELNDIDCRIKHLFNIRKQAPAHTLFGEQQVIKLTTQINDLEQCRAMSVKETIQRIVFESIDRAIKVYGAEIPVNFNLNQYEYNPYSQDLSASSTQIKQALS
jgi:hypothetical protein